MFDHSIDSAPQSFLFVRCYRVSTLKLPRLEPEREPAISRVRQTLTQRQVTAARLDHCSQQCSLLNRLCHMSVLADVTLQYQVAVH